MSNKNAIGFFSAQIKESGNDEELELLPERLFLSVETTKFSVWGYTDKYSPASWGLQIDLRYIELAPGIFPIGDHRAIYNPRTGESSWVSEEGELVIKAVDLDEKSAEGSFSFRAVSRFDPSRYADIKGLFSLKE